jgi:stage V sporulation protein B
MDEPSGGRLRSMLGDSFYVAFGSYATLGFSLLINLILVRKLSLANYGLYSVMLSAYAMGTLIFSLGALPIIQRYLPELIARGNRQGAIQLKRIAAGIHLVGSLMIAAICWGFQDQLATWLNAPEFPGLLPYFFLFLLLKFEASVYEEMLTAHRSQKFRNLSLAGFQAVKFALFWLALPQDGEIGTVMLYLVLSNALLLGMMMARAFGLDRELPAGTDEPLPWRRMIRYGLLRYTTTLTLVGFFADIDIWFITHYHDTEAAGLYGFATKNVHMLANLVPTHFLLVVLVPVYVREYTRRQDPQQLIRVFAFFNKVVTAFLAPTLVGSLLLAVPITGLIFDPKFLPSVPVFRVFFVGMFIFYFCNTSSFLLVVLERPEITLYSRIFVVYNIIMDIVLIPPYGIMGAAIATGSAMAMGYIFTYLMVKRVIPIRIPWGATFRTFAYSGIMALAIWPLLASGWISTVPRLLAAVGLGAVVYGLLAWRLPVFSHDERAHLNGALRRRVFPA